MPYCFKCGEETSENDKFCPQCGVAITPRPETASPTQKPQKQMKRNLKDPLETISTGVFFILVAFTWFNYPQLPPNILAYFKSFEYYGHPVMLPPNIYEPIIFFCTAFGVWLLILFALRIIFKQNLRAAVGNAASGVFFLYLTHLLRQYSLGLLDEALILPFMVVAIGVLAIVSGLVILAFNLSKNSRR
jgi:hypothetical protein